MDLVVFIKLLGAFAIADWALQRQYTAHDYRYKGRSIITLTAHSVVNGTIPFFVMNQNPDVFFWFAGTHWVIDYFSSRILLRLGYTRRDTMLKRWNLRMDILLHLLSIVMGGYLYG